MAKDSVSPSERDWESENAADTLLRSQEIQQQPALHKKAMAILEKRKTALANVPGIGDGAAIRKARRNPSKE
ncbi:hypothetical protein LCGC14_2221040 [marine sediment metagenome]|uniref:Uncharacterized protein n=1 Tax=marine sediment metagenome TaxID=412755 RepID=A0A0F9DAY8_9ZZZZ